MSNPLWNFLTKCGSVSLILPFKHFSDFSNWKQKKPNLIITSFEILSKFYKQNYLIIFYAILRQYIQVFKRFGIPVPEI